MIALITDKTHISINIVQVTHRGCNRAVSQKHAIRYGNSSCVESTFVFFPIFISVLKMCFYYRDIIFNTSLLILTLRINFLFVDITPPPFSTTGSVIFSQDVVFKNLIIKNLTKITICPTVLTLHTCNASHVVYIIFFLIKHKFGWVRYFFKTTDCHALFILRK